MRIFICIYMYQVELGLGFMIRFSLVRGFGHCDMRETRHSSFPRECRKGSAYAVRLGGTDGNVARVACR